MLRSGAGGWEASRSRRAPPSRGSRATGLAGRCGGLVLGAVVDGQGLMVRTRPDALGARGVRDVEASRGLGGGWVMVPSPLGALGPLLRQILALGLQATCRGGDAVAPVRSLDSFWPKTARFTRLAG